MTSSFTDRCRGNGAWTAEAKRWISEWGWSRVWKTLLACEPGGIASRMFSNFVQLMTGSAEGRGAGLGHEYATSPRPCARPADK